MYGMRMMIGSITRDAKMAMLLLITRVPERCFVSGKNFKKEMALDAAVKDRHNQISLLTGAFF